MNLDILAFGAHPDDAEIWCGGLLLKLKDRGYRTGIVHLTVGDMGSRGTPEVRRQELTAAAEALSLDHVEVLDFQDCRVTDDFPGRLKIAAVVRRLRPAIVLAPYWSGPPGRGIGHTDHQATGYLVSHGVNFAHLRALPLDGEPHAVANIFYYLFPQELPPTFVVDISDYVDRWVAALECHRSQFYNPHTSAMMPSTASWRWRVHVVLPWEYAMRRPSSPANHSPLMIPFYSRRGRSVRLVTPLQSAWAGRVLKSCPSSRISKPAQKLRMRCG